MSRKPHLLLILDGWGHRAAAADNAISEAVTPVWDHLWRDCPTTLIDTSGKAVGLPEGQMGNSEVGHMNLGAGRVVYQDFTRISNAVEDGSLAENAALRDVCVTAAAAGGAVHVLGLLSPGGVHSHQEHIAAIVRAAQRHGVERLFLHAFLDGRDTPPESAGESIDWIENVFADVGVGRIASLIGRYYAMDRDQRWERIENAYRLLFEGRGQRADSARAGLAQAYRNGQTDEFVAATAIVEDDQPIATVGADDAVIFANFRADRARQLSQALTDPEFDGFHRAAEPLTPRRFATLTEYYDGLRAAVAFPPLTVDDGLGEVVAAAGLSQLRIAETEKYAHVTFFFNGGREQPFANEQRRLIPSPKVATYDLQPEMSAAELTDELVAALTGGEFDLIVCNYANPDMVGHTGKFAAACRAAEVIDGCLDRVVEALRAAGGVMLLTADHGNLEQMLSADGDQPHTAHTVNPVPLLLWGESARLDDGGALSDIAPTLLELMGLDQPSAMSGRSLLRRTDTD